MGGKEVDLHGKRMKIAQINLHNFHFEWKLLLFLKSKFKLRGKDVISWINAHFIPGHPDADVKHLTVGLRIGVVAAESLVGTAETGLGHVIVAVVGRLALVGARLRRQCSEAGDDQRQVGGPAKTS